MPSAIFSRQQSIILVLGGLSYASSYAFASRLGWTRPYIVTQAATAITSIGIRALIYGGTKVAPQTFSEKQIKSFMPLSPLKVPHSWVLKTALRTSFIVSSLYFSFSPKALFFGNVLSWFAASLIHDSNTDISAKVKNDTANLQLNCGIELLSYIALFTLLQPRFNFALKSPAQSIALMAIDVCQQAAFNAFRRGYKDTRRSWNMQDLTHRDNRAKASHRYRALFHILNIPGRITLVLTGNAALVQATQSLGVYITNHTLPEPILEALKSEAEQKRAEATAAAAAT